MRLRRIFSLFSPRKPDRCPRARVTARTEDYATVKSRLENSQQQYWTKRIGAHPSTSRTSSIVIGHRRSSSSRSALTQGVSEAHDFPQKSPLPARSARYGHAHRTNYLEWNEEDFRRAHNLRRLDEASFDRRPKPYLDARPAGRSSHGVRQSVREDQLSQACFTYLEVL